MTSSRWLTFITFMTSTSTLLCCALPALFVTLGFGAAFAGLVSAVPQLIWVSEHKDLVFLLSGVMLAISGYLQWQARNAPCPIDPQLRDLCLKSRVWGRRIYFVSLAVYLLGFFFAYLITLF